MSREYFHLKKKRDSFAFVKSIGGWEPLLPGSGTSLSPHFTRGGAGTNPRPGQPPLCSFPDFPARPCGAGLHGPVSPLSSLPPPVCTWSAASRCRFRLFASSGLGEASSLPLPAGITGSPRVYLGLSETLIGMKGFVAIEEENVAVLEKKKTNRCV